jgi:hypothetical protein
MAEREGFETIVLRSNNNLIGAGGADLSGLEAVGTRCGLYWTVEKFAKISPSLPHETLMFPGCAVIAC